MTEFVDLSLQCELTVKNDADLPSFVRVGQSDISFSSAARNLGVIFDSELALKEQVNKLPGAEPMRRISLLSSFN